MGNVSILNYCLTAKFMTIYGGTGDFWVHPNGKIIIDDLWSVHLNIPSSHLHDRDTEDTESELVLTHIVSGREFTTSKFIDRTAYILEAKMHEDQLDSMSRSLAKILIELIFDVEQEYQEESLDIKEYVNKNYLKNISDSVVRQNGIDIEVETEESELRMKGKHFVKITRDGMRVACEFPAFVPSIYDDVSKFIDYATKMLLDIK